MYNKNTRPIINFDCVLGLDKATPLRIGTTLLNEYNHVNGLDVSQIRELLRQKEMEQQLVQMQKEIQRQQYKVSLTFILSRGKENF